MARVEVKVEHPRSGKIKTYKYTLGNVYANGREEFKTSDVSDGYHSFSELYEFRLLYNAALFNEWFTAGKYDVHKSERHSDGEIPFGGGWFVIVATLPTGQISNHYEMKDWHLFKATIRKRADKWDGHTPQDVIKRLRDFLPEPPNTTEHGKRGE